MAFPVVRVDRQLAQQFEQLGSKPKYWYRDGGERLLFKSDNRGTGEDWSEVVACHLCHLLGLPHVEYQLAIEIPSESPGVICRNMSPPPKMLIHGNQLLLAIDSQYPSSQRFKVRQHTFDAVSKIVAAILPPESEWMERVPPGISTAHDVFVGYVMLDAWIANQDRHHENWGAIWGHGTQLSLAPTFDHGAGLARNLQDAEREERLMTKDRNRSLDAFAAKGRSALYDSLDTSKPLLLLDVFIRFACVNREAAAVWINRLRTITPDNIFGILKEVPENRMSAVCRKFTLRLLELNRQRLMAVEY